MLVHWSVDGGPDWKAHKQTHGLQLHTQEYVSWVRICKQEEQNNNHGCAALLCCLHKVETSAELLNLKGAVSTMHAELGTQQCLCFGV